MPRTMTALESRPDAAEARTPATAGSRERYLDGLRALAALHVVFSHTFLEIYPQEFGVRPHGLLRIATYEMSISGLGVALLVVLSGYSLGLSARRDGWRLRDGKAAFVVRRARRLVPPYMVALALSLLLSATLLSQQTGTHWDASVPFSATDVVAHFLLLQDVLGDPYTISHPLWSIAVTWHIYLAFPLLLWAVRRFGLLRTAAVIVVVTSFITVGTHGQNTLLAIRTVELYGAFMVGLAALELTRRGGVVTWRGRTRRPRWVAIAVILSLWSGLVNDDNHTLLYLAMACLMIAVGSGGARPLRALLEWRPLVWLGTISFSLYLVHGPVVHLVWLELLDPLGLGVGEPAALLVLFATAIPASILVAWGFYHAVERRTLSSRSRARRDAELQQASHFGGAGQLGR
jgi:peptidoglycan/LPS O-acetylase OafA/YrhL